MTFMALVDELRGDMTQAEFADYIGSAQTTVSWALSGKAVGRRFLTALVDTFPERQTELVAAFLAQKQPEVA